MKWRVLPMHTTNAYMAMAIDEAVAEAVAAGKSPPTMRFWRWNPSAVSIGYFQGMEDEVNLQACRASGTDVVRRRTGGGAVFHDRDGEITYSVIAPEGMFPRGIRESYQMICGWAIEGLARMGIKASFAPINDIVVGQKKISGNAQTRRDGVLLQHGTILYKLDPEKMFSHLKISKEKISDKMIQSVHERVTKILDYNIVSIEEAYKALLQGFVSGKSYDFGTLTTEEIARAHELAEKRYMSMEWNFSR
jgi:lipoate-protein ligase A